MNAPCRTCNERPKVRYSTDGRGRLVATLEPCWCQKRRRAGVCLECHRAVYGARGKALRCALHQRAYRARIDRENLRRWKEKHGTAYRGTQKERQNSERYRKQQAEAMRERQHRWTPEQRAARNRWLREWRAKRKATARSESG